MMAMLRHAEVLIDRPGGRRCHWKLKKLTATSPTDVDIEWDPDVTVDDGRFYHQGKDTDFSVPALSTIVAEALGVADDSGSTDSALIRLADTDVARRERDRGCCRGAGDENRSRVLSLGSCSAGSARSAVGRRFPWSGVVLGTWRSHR